MNIPPATNVKLLENQKYLNICNLLAPTIYCVLLVRKLVTAHAFYDPVMTSLKLFVLDIPRKERNTIYAYHMNIQYV